MNTANDIYASLKNFGLSRAQVRKILPSWWSPDVEQHADGVAELCLLISRRLNLDMRSLMKGDVRQKHGEAAVAFKHRSDATPEALKASTLIATSLAWSVVSAMSKPYIHIQSSPNYMAMRARELSNGTVGLESLIDACWSAGIPVVPISNLPVGIRKMDGAAIKVATRPVIVISKKKTSRAWLAFIVAHELGHIASGHLEQSGSIVDVSLQAQATYESESSSDKQEREADAYALALLGGDRVTTEIGSWPLGASPSDLAVRARLWGEELGIESGHLVLRYAFLTKRWLDASNALRFLSEDADAQDIMRESLRRNLDLDLVAEDVRDLVSQITGLDNVASE